MLLFCVSASLTFYAFYRLTLPTPEYIHSLRVRPPVIPLCEQLLSVGQYTLNPGAYLPHEPPPFVTRRPYLSVFLVYILPPCVRIVHVQEKLAKHQPVRSKASEREDLHFCVYSLTQDHVSRTPTNSMCIRPPHL